MTNKWDTTRGTLDRVHGDVFGGQSRYTAAFYNYSGGQWDPDNDEVTGETRGSIGTVQVELVPPGQDSTVDTDGTSMSWTTSIRFPEDESVAGSLTPLGVDSERPTEVELSDQQDDSTAVFELHSYTTEAGSGMLLCRLAEQ